MAAPLEVIIPVFLLIGFGYIATKTRALSLQNTDGLMLFAQNFAIPCLLFRAIVTLDLGAYFEPALLTSYYIPAIFNYFLAIVLARILFKRDWEDCVVIGFACLFSNALLLGLAITERAYGPNALSANYVLLAVNAPLCYGIGITTMEFLRHRGEGFGGTARAIGGAIGRNVLVLAILLGLVINFSGIVLPQTLDSALALLGRAALPVALFALGGALSQYRLEGDIGPVIMICLMMLIVQPALSWGAARGLGLTQDAFRSLIITSAMAPGVNAYVFANMYGVAKRVVASAVLIATACCVITTWGWLALL